MPTIEKKGYKYTEEFGYIPEDWEVAKVSVKTNVVTGGTPSTNIPEYWNGNIRWMSSGELNNKRIYDVQGRITSVGLNNSSATLIPPNCVLIGLAGQGKTRGTAAINYVELATNQSIASILPSEHINHEYLYQSIDKRYEELRELSSGGGGRGGLNKALLMNLPILLPPIPEQEKIAEVLGDVDGLIDKTQQLINKKKDLKTATMQKLLTPKEDWEEKNFEQVFVKIPSKNYQINTLEYQQEGKYPVIDQGQSKICGYSDNKDKLYKNPSGIIIFGDHTRIIKYVDFDFVIGADGTQILNVKSKNNIKFVYFMLCQKDIPNTGYNRHFKFLLDFKYNLPQRTEQDKIATILSDIDSEIEALEKELNKYKDLKTGMMQQLLTGKIRLVDKKVKSDNKVVDINSVKPTRSANEEFKDAILISMLAFKFGSEKYPLGAFRRQKLSYLFKRHNNIPIEEYMKKAMGPYNHKMKYQGAESIALKNKYVRSIGDRGLVATDTISKVEEYYNRYYTTESLNWLDKNFHYESNNNLEVLTTVDYAIIDLRSQNKDITLKNIKTYILSDEEWKPKLKLDYFTDEAITKAMEKSKTLLNSY